jgi:hypothetical protein
MTTIQYVNDVQTKLVYHTDRLQEKFKEEKEKDDKRISFLEDIIEQHQEKIKTLASKDRAPSKF